MGHGARGLLRRRRRAGTTSPTTTRAAAPTAGARTGCSASRDRECRLCFALALWNGRDPILKERLFGLTGPEGNHGEDVKEFYYYLDSTPTHSYCKALYKYPQAAFPYEAAGRGERAARHATSPSSSSPTPASSTRTATSTCCVEYAKAAPDDILIRITRRRTAAPSRRASHLLPTLWFRNTWIWGCEHEGCTAQAAHRRAEDRRRARPSTRRSGRFRLQSRTGAGRRAPELLFTENETNARAAVRAPNATRRTSRTPSTATSSTARPDAVNPAGDGTKAAALLPLDARRRAAAVTVRLRLLAADEAPRTAFGDGFDAHRSTSARAEADAFYAAVMPAGDCGRGSGRVARQAYAGLLWTQAVLPLRRRGLARRRPRRSRHRRPSARAGPQPRLAHTCSTAT